MKKSELNLVSVGSEIMSKKTNEVLTVNNISEVDGKIKYQLSNGKTTTQSSLLRWYELQQVKPVEEKPVEEKPVDPKSVKLTDLEKEAMTILRDNEFDNCFDREFFDNPPTWVFVITEGLSCGVQRAKGVVGSLVKKGLVIVDEGDYNNNSKQYDTGISLTDLGYEVGKLYFNSIGQTLEHNGGVEPKPVETVEVIPVEVKPVEVKPVETVKPVEVKPVNLVDQIVEYASTHKYIVKHNSDHIVIKGSNKKNLVEIHSSKRAINLVVRHQIYSEEEQMVLNNCRIVGNGTFVLDLKFEITKLDEFINTLNRASQYVPVKKSKK